MLQVFSLSGYKGIHNLRLELSQSTAIIGSNGSGKTHVLEAIHLASGGALHYFHAGKTDENSFFSFLYKENIGIKQYTYNVLEGKDRYEIQGEKVTSIKYKESLPFRTVMLSPFDMNLLYFSPSVRRDYVDSVLSRTFSQFAKFKREYESVLKQRNALLKKIREGEAKSTDLPYWDRVFSEKAEMYLTYRNSYFQFVKNSKVVKELLPEYTINFFVETKLTEEGNIAEQILTYLSQNQERDIYSGHTHIGPHLDDFGFYLPVVSGTNHESSHLLFVHPDQEDEITNATMMLSRGEMKTLLLALKQIEIHFLKKQLSLPIILLFDDLFAELDEQHAERIINKFDVSQVIVTTQRSLPITEKWQDFSCITLKLR